MVDIRVMDDGSRLCERVAEEQLRELLADDPVALPRRVVVTGARGNGIRTLVTRGLASRLHPAAVLLPSDPAPLPSVPEEASTVIVPTSAALDALDPEAVARLHVVVACAPEDIPVWFRTTGALSVVSVSVLSFEELPGFLSARLGADVDLATAEQIGRAGGFVPAVVARLASELQLTGGIVRVGSRWQLSGPLDPALLTSHAHIELAGRSPAGAALLRRIALEQPVDLRRLDRGETEILHNLIADGLLHLREGRAEFRAPALAEAVRHTLPPHEVEASHLRVLAHPHPPAHVLQWALEHDRPVDDAMLLRAITALRAERDWRALTRLADAALPRTGDAVTRVELHLALSHAWWFRGNAEEAQAALAGVRGVLPSLHDAAYETALSRVAVAEAELAHYLAGDPDRAFALLAKAFEQASGDATRGELEAHRLLHLVQSGRHREFLAVYESDHSQALLSHAAASSRARVRVASCLALLGTGSPRAGFTRSLWIKAETTLRAFRDTSLRDELDATIFICALSSSGPAHSRAIVRRIDSPEQHDSPAPGSVGYELALASWSLAAGQAGRAYRLARGADATRDLGDPTGYAAMHTAVRAHAAALVGRTDEALRLLRALRSMASRGSAAVTGGVLAQTTSARYLVDPDTDAVTDELVATGRELIRDGLYGFAAEALHVGVRFGSREAAKLLLSVADSLDGAMHRAHVSHARAVADADPVALLDVAHRFVGLGLPGIAAEVLATIAGDPTAPERLRRSAKARGEELYRGLDLPGHRLLSPLRDGGAEPLTPRERQIRELIQAGLSNADIARRLHVSPRTVEGHITRLYRKVHSTRRPPQRRRV
ncbi:helix-turn-helix domain-containing protein [Microbacterium album]|uniref:HTH luxR-type domain-containing protein n=1 Tax=Microbacterium album TaxID=2053191 RepID=A0A917MLK7_9MICO|nr:helix-turn-helix transcriptional regulator [Microbacterium album]GGH38765.1 hypothetical protein GCM10010921_09550 [Microbacterium album]